MPFCVKQCEQPEEYLAEFPSHEPTEQDGAEAIVPARKTKHVRTEEHLAVVVEDLRDGSNVGNWVRFKAARLRSEVETEESAHRMHHGHADSATHDIQHVPKIDENDENMASNMAKAWQAKRSTPAHAPVSKSGPSRPEKRLRGHFGLRHVPGFSAHKPTTSSSSSHEHEKHKDDMQHSSIAASMDIEHDMHASSIVQLKAAAAALPPRPPPPKSPSSWKHSWAPNVPPPPVVMLKPRKSL